MIHVPWKERYSIHYQGIDQQHKELLAILNDLVDLVEQRTESDQVRAVFGRLCDYAMKHFSAEERFLSASGYGRLAHQQAEHAWFINRILELDRSYDPTDPTLLDTTLSFLKEWFTDHIMKSDQDYSGWVKSFYHRARIRGIIFGFRNVVANFDKLLYFERLAAFCQIPPEELDSRFKKESSLAIDFESGSISTEQYLEEVSRICGCAIQEPQFISILTDLCTPVRSTCELIKSLKPHYRLGLLANSDPLHYLQGIRPSEVFSLFDAVTVSFQARVLKPDARIFQDTLDQLDLIAEECVFVDADLTSVGAANALLLHGIHYRGHEELMLNMQKLKILW